MAAAANMKVGMTHATGDGSSSDASFPWLGGYAWQALAKSMKMETEFPPASNYLQRQIHLTAESRTILLDWLMEIDHLAELDGSSRSGRTLPLAVQLLDRYLSALPSCIASSHLQLAGVTAMMLASKCESGHGLVHDAPDGFQTTMDLATCVYICDYAFTKNDVKAMENEMFFNALNAFVGYAVSSDFLEYFIQASGVLSNPAVSQNSRMQFRSLCLLYCDVALLDLDIQAQHKPSAIAASAVLLAQQKLGVQEWSSTIAGLSGYDAKDLQEPCRAIEAVTATVLSTNSCPALATKYSKICHYNILDLFALSYKENSTLE